MTDKELRRLKRAELLEILYYLQKENEELKAEVEKLKNKTAQNGLPEDFMQQIRQMIQEAIPQQTAKNTSQTSKKKRR